MRNAEIKLQKVSETSLREVLKKSLNEALDFDWTGWRIPIYVDSEGNCSSGTWLSQGSWQPDEVELPVRVESWRMPDEYGESPDEADVEYEIEERIEFIINKLQDDAKEYPHEYPYSID